MDADSVRVICGPTAAGKSAIALTLALEYSATIVSADSRQIYRWFDIGTAKPSAAERRAVLHEGIDVADPAERYSASLWAASARRWMSEARSRGRAPIVVGGTGFYLRALFDPLFDAPPLDSRRRAALERFLDSMSVGELRRWCEVLDPARSGLGRVQLSRAIETALLAGERISALHAAQAVHGARASHDTQPASRQHYLVVDPGPALAARIEQRVDAMIAAGWDSEVRSLDESVAADAPAWKASGYRTMRQAARGEMDLSSARERIIIETRQYAKRQRTWFRHQLGASRVTRVSPDDPNLPAVIERWWKESS